MKTINKILLGLLAVAIIITGCVTGGPKVPRTVPEYANTSAMITLDNKRSGGSGVILKSTATQSWVLTNKHVCQLIQNGGLVITAQGEYPVHSFKIYKRHDLCLISVMVNLHVNTHLASKPPAVYSTGTIAGHPALLPTIVTTGHFANRITIALMVGAAPCDGSETDEELLMCIFMGKKPIIQPFEAQPITATIMAGSSGSGVFNSKGEIAGLVFAGEEGLSYGFIVPYEYVKDFLVNQDRYMTQYPSKDAKKQNFFADVFKMEKICTVTKQCGRVSSLGLAHD